MLGRRGQSEQSAMMSANSSPSFGILTCCGMGHMPIGFQGFLYSQTFTLKKTLSLQLRVVSLSSSASDVEPAGDGKAGSRVCELIWALIKAQVWARRHQH